MKDSQNEPVDDCQGCVFIASESVLGEIKYIQDITDEEWVKLDEHLPLASWKKVISKPEEMTECAYNIVATGRENKSQFRQNCQTDGND